MIRSFRENAPQIASSAFVSENAYLVGDVIVGENTSIWPGAILRADRFKIQIGDKCNIQDNCVIHAGSSDVIVGNNVTIGHGCVIHCARIGNSVLIGMQTTLREFSEIGDLCIVGAHSMVKEYFKVPRRSLLVGVPGRIRKSLSDRQIEEITRASNFYTALSREFKEDGL